GIIVAAQHVSESDVASGQTKTGMIAQTGEQVAQVKRFTLENHPQFAEYEAAFAVPTEKIRISANKPDFDLPLSAVNDGDKSTYWAPSTRDDVLQSEVEFNFDELVTLDALTYVARQNVNVDSGGFPHEFEIYGAMADDAEYTLIASGAEATATKDTIAIHFPTTTFKKLKFKFISTSTRTKWAHIAEIDFYQPDAVQTAMNELFTDSSKSAVNPTYQDEAVLTQLQAAVVDHPFEAEYTASIIDAQTLLNHTPVEVSVATVQAFKHFDNTAYNTAFKIPTEKIKSISNNAGHYSSRVITNAIDNDPSTYWETNKGNSASWNNEVTVDFTQAVTIDRLVFGARPDRKGFATKFEVYASPTSEGETFELLATGDYNAVTGLVEAKFDAKTMKRVKFKFVQSNQNWATLNELAFYQADEVAAAMQNLYTDSQKNTLNPEFNSVEALTQLQTAVNVHPLSTTYTETLANAWIILNHKPIEVTKANTKPFTEFENVAYSDLFKMPTSNITKITNNAGHYSSRVITNAIDNDPSTYWETNQGNSASWKNEVEVSFNKATTLDRIVFGARPDKKGFATKFEVYVSPTSEGETFELLTTGGYNAVTGLVEATFAPTEMKRVRFKFVESTENWATLSEIAFYQEDALTKTVNDVFVDQTYLELKSAYQDASVLDALYQQVLAHPANTDLKIIMELAIATFNGTANQTYTMVTADQNGDMSAHAKNTLAMSSAGQNYQATGIYGLPGEKVIVYLDVEAGTTVLPKISFAQNQGSWRGYMYTLELKPGRNEITVPTFDLTSDIYAYKPNPGGAAYIVNPYTPEQQGNAPKIRIEGGHEFPFYRQGDDEAAFLESVKAYQEKLTAAQAVGDGSVLDLLEVEGDRVLISTLASSGYQSFINEGQSPAALMDYWNTTYNKMLEFQGLDV
ncbi:MAG: discoidin domain-containing protein, partial [Culicoidibacterales bacterium]